MPGLWSSHHVHLISVRIPFDQHSVTMTVCRRDGERAQGSTSPRGGACTLEQGSRPAASPLSLAPALLPPGLPHPRARGQPPGARFGRATEIAVATRILTGCPRCV